MPNLPRMADPSPSNEDMSPESSPALSSTDFSLPSSPESSAAPRQMLSGPSAASGDPPVQQVIYQATPPFPPPQYSGPTPQPQLPHPGYLLPSQHAHALALPRQQPVANRMGQIYSPFDLLVPYSYFSQPRGFKPYHFRQCFMPTAEHYVIVEKAWSTQTDLDIWSPLLLDAMVQRWIDMEGKSEAKPPICVKKPRVQVCPLFSDEMQRAIDREIPPELEQQDIKLFKRLHLLSQVEDQVIFFVVVQGTEERAAAKLVVKETFYQIMTEMFYTAANGFNVVFSGVMRQQDYTRLGAKSKATLAESLKVWTRLKKKLPISFTKVERYEDLIADYPNDNVIRIGC